MRYKLMRLIFILFFITLNLFVSSFAIADDDQEEARRALATGQIIPLKDILKNVEKALPGNDVIKVKFDSDDGFYTYELKVIDAQGVVREVEIDAKSGQILEIEVDD